MANGWNGADPVESVDATQYELGTEFLVNQDITITHVRVWAGSGEINLSGRTGTIWSTGGAELSSVDMPTDLPTGWSMHQLPVPVERTAGSRFVVSFGTGGNEGALSHGLDVDVPSADGAVTALGFGNATGNTNGRFKVGTPGAFPNNGNANHAFYGADIAYTLGIGGNTAPTITNASVTHISDNVASAIINATDAESLTGASYRFDWGDGSTSVTNHPTNTMNHMYAEPGTYPVLLSVTDAEGLSAYVARYVQIPDIATEGSITPSEILDLLVSQTKKLKKFKAVLKHEPRSAPTEFVTAAFFLGAPNAAPGGFQTVKRVSDLQHAGMRLDVICRLYMDAKAPVPYAGKPPLLDNIDQVLLEHAELIMRQCHAAVSFGIQDTGIWTDANGADSEGLGGLIGYLDQDQTKFRICEIYIPVIISTYFQQGI